MRYVFQHPGLFGLAYFLIYVLRQNYLEFKIGELLVNDPLAMKELDAAQMKNERSFRWIDRLVGLVLVGLLAFSHGPDVHTEYWVVVLFAAIAASGWEILKAVEQRRLLLKFAPMRPILWRLHLFSIAAMASAMLFIYFVCVKGGRL